MLLSFNQLMDLIDNGIIARADPECVNSASIDIRLGNKILIEHCCTQDDNANLLLHRVVLKDRNAMKVREWDLEKDGPFTLYPGEFVLAHSYEVFNLPNNVSAEYKLKSSMARIGLEHLNAGWCDAGWHGSVLTLELKNVTRGHEIVLHAMDKIGQMVFMRHEPVPADKSYAARGRYNNDRSVSGAKLDPERSIVFGDEAQELMQEQWERDHPSFIEFFPVIKRSQMKLDEEGEEVTA